MHHSPATLVVLIATAALGAMAAEKTYWGCAAPSIDPKGSDVALKKFYDQTKGESNWPAVYKQFWGKEHSCAWDGNTIAVPSPFGTRCINGGAWWNKLPPTGIGGLQYFEHFSGFAEGPIPAEFKVFQMVGFLGLWGNKLSGPIWDTSYHCFLHKLDLSKNQMSGPLGENFLAGDVTHGEIINLSYNKFDGPIPKTLSTLAPLSAVVFNHNEFSGEIPDLSNAKNLRHLDLSSNKLTGRVGDWIGSMEKLAWLDVSDNAMSGELPKSLPKFLSRFSLGGNKWTGAIPASYADAPHLKSFNCTGCDLTCPTPDLLAHVPFSTHCKGTLARGW